MTISDIVKGQYWDDNCCIVPISDQDNWELVEQKHCLLFFESWYPAENRWVKQVAVGKPKEKSEKAVSI